MAKRTEEMKAYENAKDAMTADSEKLLRMQRLQTSPVVEMRRLPSVAGNLNQGQLKSMFSDENRQNFLGMQQMPGGNFLSVYKDGKGGFVGVKSDSRGNLSQQMDVPSSLLPSAIKDPQDYDDRFRVISESPAEQTEPDKDVVPL